MDSLVLLGLFVNAVRFTFGMGEYWLQRNEIIEIERSMSVGGTISLNGNEKVVNERLVNLKKSELDKVDCPAFAQFVNVRIKIEESDVYKFIQRLPKGGSLHTHLFASVSYNYVCNNLLKRENLYLCNIDGREKLKFLLNDTGDCVRVSEILKDDERRKNLHNQLLLNSEDTKKNATEAWDKFRKIFTLTYDLFTYIDVFKDYVYQLLLEHYNDNVLYIEVKAPFVYLYELDGTIYDEEYFIRTLYKINNKFRKRYPKFIGMKYICALYRKLDSDTLTTHLSKLKALMVKYNDFIIGFDFVGFEEDAPLKANFEILKKSGLNLYLHAGETNSYGDTTDENLIDAILLDSKRIGHAFSLSKHPQLQNILKEKNIAIEVCPISNQVLKMVSDLRNHPASSYIASGLPIVVCNDDPGNWNAEGLSHDWYMTFMAMTHRESGLEFLKKLSLNSIEHSGMNEKEKETALVILKNEWNEFVNETLLLSNNSAK